MQGQGDGRHRLIAKPPARRRPAACDHQRIELPPPCRIEPGDHHQAFGLGLQAWGNGIGCGCAGRCRHPGRGIGRRQGGQGRQGDRDLIGRATRLGSHGLGQGRHSRDPCPIDGSLDRQGRFAALPSRTCRELLNPADQPFDRVLAGVAPGIGRDILRRADILGGAGCGGINLPACRR
ncbi:hypothetical protein WG926_14555 [Tistrella sp. BH-R2-4]|uniref:Uncharacterized protein n=1 Tax=Tistrella arctica TaxID=3133430 RepID=A0ABU9YL51_9PROT